jgi:hypothetical protein
MPKKNNKSVNNIIKDNVSLEKEPKIKSRKQINQENYRKNKEKIKDRQKERYNQEKEQAKLAEQNIYEANSIQVLLSFKEYTELNQQKHKLWLDFAWTLGKVRPETVNDMRHITTKRSLNSI